MLLVRSIRNLLVLNPLLTCFSQWHLKAQEMKGHFLDHLTLSSHKLLIFRHLNEVMKLP